MKLCILSTILFLSFFTKTLFTEICHYLIVYFSQQAYEKPHLLSSDTAKQLVLTREVYYEEIVTGNRLPELISKV